MSEGICRVLLTLCIMGAASLAFAQNEQEHQLPAPDHLHAAAGADIATRETSGTAWLPDLIPMYGSHRQKGEWEVMLHGNLFAQFLCESGEVRRRSR